MKGNSHNMSEGGHTQTMGCESLDRMWARWTVTEKDRKDYDNAFDVEEESNNNPVIKANADLKEAKDKTNLWANKTD